eukprot:309036_1
MTATNITENKNNNSISTVSMKSLVNGTDFGYVFLSNINVEHNYASQYLIFQGNASSDFLIEDSSISHNMNNGPFEKNILIQGNNYINGIIKNTNFINNKNGTSLFLATFTNDLDVINVHLSGNEVDNTLMDIQGISSLNITDINVSENTAINSILFRGSNSGNVFISNINFDGHNQNGLIDGDILILLDSFINSHVEICDIFENDGNYLFKGILSGNISFNECNIYHNYINQSIVTMTSEGGFLTLSSSNIISNVKSKDFEKLGIKSMINITNISHAMISDVNIENNSATQYIVVDGASSGDLQMRNTVISHNKHSNGFENALIKANNFKNGFISNSEFFNNKNGTSLFTGTFGGNLNITNVDFGNNIVEDNLIDMIGITSLTLIDVNVLDNNAINGILFGGTNIGNVDITNFKFERHNQNLINGETLILFDSFIDLNINICNLIHSSGDYLLKAILRG